MNAHCVTTPRATSANILLVLGFCLASAAGCTQIAPESLKPETASARQPAPAAKNVAEKTKSEGFFARMFKRRQDAEKPGSAARIAAKREARRKPADARALLAEAQRKPARARDEQGGSRLADRSPSRSHAGPQKKTREDSEIALVEARERNARLANEAARRTARRGGDAASAKGSRAENQDDAGNASHSNKLARSVSNLINRRAQAAEDPFLEETAQVARSGGSRATAQKPAAPAARSHRDAQDPLSDPALDFARSNAPRLDRSEREALREELDRSLPLASRSSRPVERMTADEFLKLTGGGPVKGAPKHAVAGKPASKPVHAAHQPKVEAAAAAAEPADTVHEVQEQVAQTSYELERARGLLERAKKMASEGFPEEARRLASIAQLLERSHPELFEAEELRPSEFLATLTPAATENAAPSAEDSETAGVASAHPPVADDSHSSVAEPIVSRNLAGTVKRGALANHLEPEIRPGDAKYVELPEPESEQVGRYNRTPRESILEYHSRRIARPGAGQEPVDRRGDIVTAGSELPQRHAERKDRNLLVALAEAVDAEEEAEHEPEVTTAEARKVSDKLSEQELSQPSPPIEQDVFEMDAQSDLAAAPPAPAAGRKPPGVNGAAVAGLVIGLMGMVGLGLWQRAERRHYKASVNHRVVSAAAPMSAR